MRPLLITIFLICAWSPLAFACENCEEGHEAKHRAARVGISVASLLNPPTWVDSKTSFGPNLVYEFILKPKYVLGILMNYRVSSGSPSVRQMVYGLLMKHYFSENIHCLRTYAEYGLLLNVTRRSDLSGAGTAHDTQLSLGMDIPIGKEIGFVQFSYHYSRLSFFAVDSQNFDYLELAFGWRPSF